MITLAIHALDVVEAVIIGSLFALAAAFVWIGVKEQRREERVARREHPVVVPFPQRDAPYDWAEER